MADDGRSGMAVVNYIVNTKNRDTHQNITTNMLYLLSPGMLISNKLGQDDVPTCSLKDQKNKYRQRRRRKCKGWRQQF